MKVDSYSIQLADADGTRRMGASLGKVLVADRIDQPFIIHLKGELGAGKTTFASGMLNGMGYVGAVRSPTYTLIEPYELSCTGVTTATINVMHMDLYRLTDPSQLNELGVRDMLIARTVLMIEWPERAGEYLPQSDIVINLAYPAVGVSGRALNVVANSALAWQLLQQAYSHTLTPHES